jgi:putative transposase
VQINPGLLERKAIRVRLDPTEAQRAALERSAGARRFIYNWALDRRREHYRDTGRTLAWKHLSAELTQLKQRPETVWLREVDAQMLQQALADLQRAFENFFARRARYPRFKSRKRDPGRFRIPQRVKVNGSRLFVPKVGHVRLSEEIDLTGLSLKAATFKETPGGRWFVTLTCEFEVPAVVALPVSDDARTIGLDLGLKDLLVLSNGERIKNPRWFRAQERKLRRAQRTLSRTEKGSSNHTRARARVARVHEQTRNRRQDFIHKLTTRLVSDFDTLVIEDLSVSGLARTKLAKSIYDAAFAEIRRQIEYKCRWQHKNLVVIDRWYPSSKTCGACGLVNNDLSLNDRRWVCRACGTDHDRDLNAARNIRLEGLRQKETIVAVGDTETLNARGGRVRRPKGALAIEARTLGFRHGDVSVSPGWLGRQTLRQPSARRA